LPERWDRDELKGIWPVLLVALSYLLGSFNLSYLAGRLAGGVDLRKVGSGNLGTGNLFHQVGKGLGALVFFADCGKEAAALLVPRTLGLGPWWQVACGLAMIAGHNWPVFLGFRGGRGMAMVLTGTLILMPWEGLAMTALLALGVFTRRTAELNLLALLLVPLLGWRLGRDTATLAFALGALIFACLRRAQGSPEVSGLTLSATRGRDRYRLLWSRLVYDREPPRGSRRTDDVGEAVDEDGGR